MPSIQIHLTSWKPWIEREKLPDTPGVYVIAKGTPDNQIYVGKTWGGEGLRGRLRDFNRSACTGQKGHSGGVTYNTLFGGDVEDLFIATHATKVIRDDPAILNAYILYAERTLIWEHVELHGKLPVCNAD